MRAVIQAGRARGDGSAAYHFERRRCAGQVLALILLAHHLPDGPEQRARDAAFAAEDPLGHNDWIHAYDAERAAAPAAQAAVAPAGRADGAAG
jgi:hypothetical protein